MGRDGDCLTSERFIPLGGHPTFRDQLRRVWLWVIGLLGAAMVVAAVLFDLHTSIEEIWSDVLLNTGSGALLFAVLFWAERRLVVREIAVQTQQIVQSITGSSDLRAEFANDPDAVNLDQRFADDRQIGTAMSFLGALASGRYEDAWALADDDWRLCRVQAWLWNNRDHFGRDEGVLDELAATILQDLSSALALAFVEVERAQYVEEYGGIDMSSYGAASRRRIVAPGYEVVLLIPLDGYPGGVIVRQETLVRDAVPILAHWTENGWRVAAFGAEVAPSPGWPPSWWIRHDPAAIRWFEEAGLE